MTSHEFEDIVQRYLRNECTSEENDLVEEWFAGMSQDNAEDLNADQKTFLKKKLWNKMTDAIDERSGRKTPVRKLNYRTVLSVAATISVVVISAAIYLRSSDKTIEQVPDAKSISATSLTRVLAGNKQQTILLSDGSSVTLEPGSELGYPENFGDIRQVQLKGEAFFKITRDEVHPFEVYSGEIVTHVLGTSFRVKAYDHSREIVVAVRSGKVSVSPSKERQTNSSTTKETILLPNQQVVYQRMTGDFQKVLVEKPVIIKKDPSMKMTYTNAPVSEIFEALSTLYAVDVQFDKEALGSCTLTTDLSEEGLFERLEIICHAVNATYTVNNAVVVIEGKGCN